MAKAVKGLLGLADLGKLKQTGRLREYSNATSKDPNKILEDWMKANQSVIEQVEYPTVNLSDFEGRGYVLGESDRAIANRRLEGIGNNPLSSPIDLNTGSNFIFHNPQVWSSGKSPISRMMNQAKALKEQTGQNPIMMPRLLGPKGVDFDKNVATAMMRYNLANAPKQTLKQQDNILKMFLPNWRGANDPQSMEAFYGLPAKTRKAVQVGLDKLKNEGGLSLGNARIAITNPDYIDAPNQLLASVAEMDVAADITKNSNINYPYGFEGKGLGLLSEPLTAQQIVSPSGEFFKKDGSLVAPANLEYFLSRSDTSGILSRDKLNQLSDAGVKFKSGLLPTAGTASAAGAGLLGAFQSEDADAGFFSQAVRAAANLSRKSGNAQGFFNDLTGKGQVKPDELNAMGFQEHFGNRSDISREEVQSFISDNQLQLQETRLGRNAKYGLFDADDDQLAEAFPNREEAEAALARVGQDAYYLANYGSGQDTSKFGDYTLDDGDNYRELLLQTKTSQGLLDQIEALDAQRWDIESGYRNSIFSRDGIEADNAVRKRFDAAPNDIAGLKDPSRKLEAFIASDNPYYASLLSDRNALSAQKDSLPEAFINGDHFDEENILAHLRMKDRVDAEGNKTLLVEEAQSDWHQTGAQEGYQTPNKRKELQDEYDRVDEEIEQAYELLRELPAGRDETGLRILINNLENRQHDIGLEDFDQRSLVPDAPFKTDDKSSWYNLAMKRALIEAAEGDYDKLAFTTGKQQAERYDLSQSIGSLKYQEDMVDGRPVNILTAYDNQGMRVFNKRIDDPEKEMPSIIGKDAAKALLNAEPYTPPQETRSIKTLRGQELSIGGEGMKQFYDRTLPNTLNKLVKQDGVKVGQSELNTTRDRTDTVHSIDITPEMRERVKKGLPLFTTAAAIPAVGGLLSPRAQAQGVLDMADAETNAAVRQQRLDRSKESPIMEMMSHAGLGLGQDILGNLAGIALPSLEQPVRDLVRPEDSRGPTAKAISSQVANNFAPLIDNYIAPAMQNYVAPAAKAAYDYQPVFGGSAREQVNGLMDLYRQLPSSVREQVSPRIKNIGGLLESVL